MPPKSERAFNPTEKQRSVYCVNVELHLEHGLLVFAVFHLSCGQVEHAPLHWILVTVVDEDVGPAHDDKVLHPRVGARLHEAQETLFRHNRSDRNKNTHWLNKVDLLQVEILQVQKFKSIYIISAWIRKQVSLFFIWAAQCFILK